MVLHVILEEYRKRSTIVSFKKIICVFLPDLEPDRLFELVTEYFSLDDVAELVSFKF